MLVRDEYLPKKSLSGGGGETISDKLKMCAPWGKKKGRLAKPAKSLSPALRPYNLYNIAVTGETLHL